MATRPVGPTQSFSKAKRRKKAAPKSRIRMPMRFSQRPAISDSRSRSRQFRTSAPVPSGDVGRPAPSGGGLGGSGASAAVGEGSKPVATGACAVSGSPVAVPLSVATWRSRSSTRAASPSGSPCLVARRSCSTRIQATSPRTGPIISTSARSEKPRTAMESLRQPKEVARLAHYSISLACQTLSESCQRPWCCRSSCGRWSDHAG